MAIIVDNQQKAGGILSFAIWLVIIVIIAMGMYYVFFKQPELIQVATSSNLKATEQIAKISLDPAGVIAKIQPPMFQPYITIPQAKTNGRPNPFLGF